MTERLQLATEMMRANARFHADQARRHVGKPCFHLATRPLLPQHNCTALIETNHVERVLANIDADEGNLGCLRHGVLLVFGAPCQHKTLAGQEHGRTIPLSDMAALASIKRWGRQEHGRTIPFLDIGLVSF
jgi:hypothetical protein